MANHQDENIKKGNNLERQIKSMATSKEEVSQQTSEKAGDVKNSTSKYERIYIDLFNLVNTSLKSDINKDKIEKTIEGIVQAFLDKPYNELLLYSYTMSKDNYLIAHITNNVILSVGFAVNMELEKNVIVDVGLCAFCHDFGMKGYSGLYQKGITLSDDENKLIQKHPLKSAEIFKPFFPERIIEGILDIHEQVNGKGYPAGKSGGKISFLAKCVSLCDVFEALTHSRNYRKAGTPYEAIKAIISKKNIFFDTPLLKNFVEFLSIYPIGNLVYLNTGKTAIVVGSNRGFPTRSIVRILLDAKKEVDTTGKVVNLLEDNMLYISGCIDPKEEEEVLHFLKPRGDITL